MKSTLAASLLALTIAFAPGIAVAKGCITGAIAGAAAGHLSGHGALTGAVVGCVTGHTAHSVPKSPRDVHSRELSRWEPLQHRDVCTACTTEPPTCTCHRIAVLATRTKKHPKVAPPLVSD
jgi:hypothetical protein